MGHSILEDFFVFILILAGAWCVQYSFTSLFDSLINDCLPLALGSSYTYYRNASIMERLITLLPFVIFYGLICFLISAIAELTVQFISEDLYKKKKLRKYCLDDSHQAFFSQLLSFVIILIIPGWLSLEPVTMKFIFLIIAGGLSVMAYLYLCLTAAYCNKNGVYLLWGLVSIISFIITWIISRKFLFSVFFILISLFMIPIRNRISEIVDHVFDDALLRILSVSEDDIDDFDDEDDLIL